MNLKTNNTMKTKLLKKIRSRFLIKYIANQDNEKMLYIFDIKRNKTIPNRWTGFDTLPDLALILVQMNMPELLKKYWNKKALKQFNKL